VEIYGPIGEEWRNRFCASPLLVCPLCCPNTIDAAFLLWLQAKSDEFLKNQCIFVMALWMRLALAIGTASAPHFAYKRRVQLRIIYCPNIIGVMLLVPLDLFFQNSPINWTVLNRNGNMTNIRLLRILCPAGLHTALTRNMQIFLIYLFSRAILNSAG
jgi:hypothetical protein